MIKATFQKKNNQIVAYKVTGHARYADVGQDIVCAGVSSLYITITNQLLSRKLAYRFVEDESIKVGGSEIGQLLAEALYDGITDISCNYPDNVVVIIGGLENEI
ncbi:MAG: ribosomal-processing cysteine protease Prp [Streptococcaceae bacterium]|jgi:uncharacterized protein YsxB (DUF464 family)|nr:ribosomal-processing cysteine protease Prp [Streptococcaceae bacterium]